MTECLVSHDAILTMEACSMKHVREAMAHCPMMNGNRHLSGDCCTGLWRPASMRLWIA